MNALDRRAGHAPTVRIGTRGSALARAQAARVAGALERLGARVEVVVIVTAGDRRAPDTAWGEGAFVGALEDALRAGEVDLAVHSAKDVPLDPGDGRLVVAAHPEREDPRDVLVAGAPGLRLADLPTGVRIGTDSPRRAGFLLAERPDVHVVPLHGNVDTRLERLDRGDAEAIVLAAAGLIRLGRADRIVAPLDPSVVPPAPGQGALAVQARADDPATLAIAAALDDPTVRREVDTERAVLGRLGGGCRAPVGALARIVDGTIRVVAGVVEPDGRERRIVDAAAAADDAVRVAIEVAERLMGSGRSRPAAIGAIGP